MKTLVFCTSWSDSSDMWFYRYGKWLNQIQRSSLKYEQILFVDDASPVQPSFDGLVAVDADNMPANRPEASAVIARFKNRLGRHALLDYPGWWRSFNFASEYAARYGFDKVVHIESDTFILSRLLYDYINNMEKGWTVFWCPRWQFPETCIQIICPDQMSRYRDVTAQPYSSLVGKPAEKVLPFTHIELNFKGDRYGEYRSELPLDADYASQTPWSTVVWHDTPPIPRNVLALSIGKMAQPLHQSLYPDDAWHLLGYLSCQQPSQLIDALTSLPANSIHSIQLSLVNMEDTSSLPAAFLRQLLSADGELIINIRPGVEYEITLPLSESLNKHGFSTIAQIQIPSGNWIIAIANNTRSLSLVENRISHLMNVINLNLNEQ